MAPRRGSAWPGKGRRSTARRSRRTKSWLNRRGLPHLDPRPRRSAQLDDRRGGGAVRARPQPVQAHLASGRTRRGARGRHHLDLSPSRPRTTFHLHMGAGDGAVLAHGLLTTGRHREAQDDTRRHRTTWGGDPCLAAATLGSGARKGVGVRLSPLAPPLTWESPFSDSFEQAAERTSCPRLPTEPAGVAASRRRGGSCDGLLHSGASSRCRNLCRSSSPVASVCLGSTRLRSRLRRSSENQEVAPLSLAQQQHHSRTADAAHGASVARPADGRSLCAE